MRTRINCANKVIYSASTFGRQVSSMIHRSVVVQSAWLIFDVCEKTWSYSLTVGQASLAAENVVNNA